VLTLLEKDDFFGEMALINTHLRSATATAITRTRLLALSRDAFLQKISYSPDIVLKVLKTLCGRIDRITRQIRTMIDGDAVLHEKLFMHPDTPGEAGNAESRRSCPRTENSELPERTQLLDVRPTVSGDIPKMLNFSPEQTLALEPGRPIFEHGDVGESMYFIAEGTVEIFQAGTNGACRIALLGPGDFFGEMALISENPRSASARALSHVQLQKIRRKEMLEGILSDAPTGLFFLQVLIHRLRDITLALEDPENALLTLRQAIAPNLKRGGKTSLGISSLASCGGCAAVFVQDVHDLDGITADADIRYCPMLMDHDQIDAVEIAIVDGIVRTREDARKLFEIRRKSRILVAWGSCAVFGGIPVLANQYELEELLEESYGRTVDPFTYYMNEVRSSNNNHLRAIEALLLPKARPVSDFVRVDYYLPGCPPRPFMLEELIQEFKTGRVPSAHRQIVCAECRRRVKKGAVEELHLFPAQGNPEDSCFLSQGVVCLGFLTRGGCTATCPGGGLPCWGCRGPANNVINKMKHGEYFEEVLLHQLSRRLKQDPAALKPLVRSLRFKGGGALSFAQHVVTDVSRIR
jgi:F420-non-reducing hydrogenase small subunit